MLETQPSNLGEIRIWRSNFESLELHRGIASQHLYPRHWHEEFLVVAVTGGGGYLHYPGVSHFTPAGTIFVVAPGEVHANSPCVSGCSFRSTYIPTTMMARALEEVPRIRAGPALPLHVISDPEIVRGFIDFHRIVAGPMSGLQCESSFLTFISRLTGHGTTNGSTRAAGSESVAVRRAREFLMENYDQGVSLKELAQLTNLSPYYFHRSFCRHTGMPPHAYQMQIRIARAKGLLREKRSIAEVASATGFADQSHFTRHFKRLVGVTPAQYSC